MRRMFLLFLFVLLPSFCMAAPAAMPYDPQLSLMYRTLTEEQRGLFDQLYDAAAAGTERVDFQEPAAYDDVSLVMDVLRLDCPELCALGYECVLSYYKNRPNEATGITLEYTLPLTRQKQLLDRAEALALTLEGDGREAAQQAHDLVCELAEYEPSGESPHTAYGSLLCGQAVCDGYTKGFVLLCRLKGIPCSLVNGTAQGTDGAAEAHSWAMLQLGGGYTLADVTWDDRPDGAAHDFLFVTDEQLKGHTRDETALLLPAAEVSFPFDGNDS